MDYEKLYKKALSRARQFSEHPLQEDSDSIVEYIFPELKESESEDERVRKKVIEYMKTGTYNRDYIRYAGKYSHEIWRKLMDNFKNIKDYHIGCNEVSDIVLNAIIDTFNWLEKGGDKNKVSKHVEAINEEKVDDANKVEPKDYNSIDPHFGKPADKVETKFKVGDFIVNDYCSGKVIKITDDAYLLDTGQGIPFSCEHNAHLWNVTKDAKDGDVLATKKGNLFIYDKNRYNNGLAYYYVGLVNKELTIKGPHNMLGHFGKLHSVFPATKEQRDTLEKAMADAGYEWSDKDRKLIKIVK